MAPNKYPEAFALLVYDGPDGRSETIWNSRDGIAPWEIPTRDGKGSMWTRDEFAGIDPDYVPKPGERVIVDWDPEEYRAERIREVALHWDTYAESFKLMQGVESLEEAVENLKANDYAGAPRLVIVDHSGWPNVKK